MDISEIDTILEKDKKNAEAWGMKGDLLFKKTQFYDALICYTKSIACDPNYSDAWRGKGIVNIMQNNTPDALQCLDRAIYLRNNDAESYRLKSHAFFWSKVNQTKIIEHIDKALELEPNNNYILLSKALHLKNARILKDSLECFNKVVSIDPNDLVALVNKNKIANNELDTKTIEILFRLYGLKDDDVDTIKQYGDRFLVQFDFHSAIDCYDKILSVKPNDYDALRKKGIISLIRNDLKNALDLISISLQYNPDDTDSWTRKGEILRRQNKILESIECFDSALKIDDKNAEAWRRKGFTQSMRHEKIDEAISSIDKSLQIDPYHPMAYAQKARFLSRDSGKWSDAIFCLNRSNEIDPTFLLAWVLKADIYTRAGDYESAYLCYDNILNLDPEDVASWYNAGVIKAKFAEKEFQKGKEFFSKSKFKLALECFNKVLEIDAEDTETIQIKNDILMQLGNE